jgi:hypothetical protein
MKNLLCMSAVTLLGFSAGAFAIESTTRGQLQLQATYYEPEIGDDSRWALSMPNGYIGVTAAEQLASSAIIAHWQVGVDPLADGTEAALTQQEAYINWSQGIVSLWAGRLASLENAYLESFYKGAFSLPAKGIQASSSYEQQENSAVRLDVSSGDSLVFSGQWIIDENESETEWSAAGAIRTPEGTVSVTYRKPEGEAAIWGNQITWEGQTTSVSAVWLLQEEVVAWDVEARGKVQALETFLGFGKDSLERSRYVAGIHQRLSTAVTNFSEFMWRPDEDEWQWTTGFQVTF